jgi:hypothetical protein
MRPQCATIAARRPLYFEESFIPATDRRLDVSAPQSTTARRCARVAVGQSDLWCCRPTQIEGVGTNARTAAAYKEWLPPDEAVMYALDAMLQAINRHEGLIDLDAVERLSSRANVLRLQSDQKLRRALAAVHRHGQEPARGGEDTGTRCASLIRTIVDMGLRQIGRRSDERHNEPVNSQR